ncbi:hypothetical protein [Marinomonas algicola]|uniref:hypothetical protein n=1 Tax=Marinomonas algicola TaxID=2773454 RepID=UPI00174B1578|nr:hypothetical protein [Marinomonas algicola]
MTLESLLRKSVRLRIIDESQRDEILALKGTSRPWMERLFDVALLIMPLSALGILWHLSNGDRITGFIIALAFLTATIFANKLLNEKFISLHLVCASACGLLALSGSMILLPTLVSDTSVVLPLFSTGALGALWASKGRNKHTLIKIAFVASLVISIASWLDAANIVNTSASYLIVSTSVFFCSILPFRNGLTSSAQIVGASFFMFSLLIFTLAEVDNDVISIIMWGLTIVIGVVLKSRNLMCVENLSEGLIAAGSLCMTGTIMNAVIDRIGYGIPVVVMLMFLSLVIVVIVKKR